MPDATYWFDGGSSPGRPSTPPDNISFTLSGSVPSAVCLSIGKGGVGKSDEMRMGADAGFGIEASGSIVEDSSLSISKPFINKGKS